jgi:putative transposase
MMLRRAFKYKLKPTSQQKVKCLQFAGARRYIFNRGLHERNKAYETTGKSPSYFEQNKELTPLKEQPETTWLGEIHSQVLQQSLKDLDRAFTHFFRRMKQGEKPGHPRFKKKGQQESFRYPQGVKVEDNLVFLPKIGWVKFHKSREIKGTIQETTILQEGSSWFVSFSCEIETTAPKPAPLDENRAIGIDVGLTHFATTAATPHNHCQTIENPRFLKKLLPRLRYLSRQHSKKAKKGKNSLKARLKLSKLHARIKNQRNDFVQKLSTEMIKNHDIFCVESLDIASLLQKSPKPFARAISDVGWRSFLLCLKYKSEEQGKHLVEAGKYFPSSQLCAQCDTRQKMPLRVREYNCTHCGNKSDRDENSAIVLKAAGMTVLKACGAALVGGSVEAGISRL